MNSIKRSERDVVGLTQPSMQKNNGGYTLVELLVGLTVSLLTGAVAITFMMSSSRMLANQSAEDVIQENARFALEILASSVRLAGANTSSDLQTQSLSQGVFRERDICGSSGNEACNRQNMAYQAGITGKNAISATTDRLAIEYITDQGTTCTGQTVTAEQRIVHEFYVADNSGVSSLYCRAHVSALDFVTQSFDTYAQAGNATPLIDGVEMLQVQYGVDIDNTADSTIDRYVNYDALAANTDWFSRIKAIKLGLIFSDSQGPAGEVANTEQNQARTYQVLDGRLTASDGVLRKAISTTVFLPNSNTDI